MVRPITIRGNVNDESRCVRPAGSCRDRPIFAFPPLLTPKNNDGDVPSKGEMHRAAEVLRRVVATTRGLPDDSPADAHLRDRLDLAADVLDATSEGSR